VLLNILDPRGIHATHALAIPRVLLLGPTLLSCIAIYIIGTGKTTTIVELIRRAVLQHGMKVLVAAPSNVAVDNVLSRLVTKNSSSTSTVPITDPGDDVHGDDDNDMLHEENKNKPKRNSRESKIKKNKKLRLVRLGHPARLQAHILPYSLEALVQSSDGTEVVADARQELQSLLRILSSSNNKKTKSGSGGENHYAKKAAAYREVKLLRKEIRQREEQVVQELLHQADVVLATCVGAANRLLGNANGTTKKSDNKSNVSFDLVVIDEAAQALVSDFINGLVYGLMDS
jgi:superfamily I DNA and/or RNA helicase